MSPRHSIILCLVFILPLMTYSQEEDDNKYFNKRWDTLSVQERKIPGEAIERIRQDKAFWWLDSGSGLNSKANIKEAPSQNDSITVRPWFQFLLWVIILGGFAVFLGIYLAGAKIGLFRKKNQQHGNAEAPAPMPENIFAINYQKEIDKAVEQENFRLAVRLHFLHLLKNLADRNLIRYKQDKTNFDYLTELNATNYYTPFFRATRNYEYSWYGLFPVSNEAYLTIKKDFDNLDRQLI